MSLSIVINIPVSFTNIFYSSSLKTDKLTLESKNDMTHVAYRSAGTNYTDNVKILVSGINLYTHLDLMKKIFRTDMMIFCDCCTSNKCFYIRIYMDM